MKIARKFGIVLATTALGFGLLGMTAPTAQADTSWGYVSHSR